MQLSPNAERPYNAHMVAQDAVIASSRGTKISVSYQLTSALILFLVSILRAFLVEEAKIVKKVIKSQEKAAASK